MRWIERTLSDGLPSAGDVPWAQTVAAMVVFAAILVGLGLLVSRARRSPRVARDATATSSPTSRSPLLRSGPGRRLRTPRVIMAPR